MTLIWEIKMHILANGKYRVIIHGEGGYAYGLGRTAYDAYRAAEIKLVIKPACEWIKP